MSGDDSGDTIREVRFDGEVRLLGGLAAVGKGGTRTVTPAIATHAVGESVIREAGADGAAATA